MFDVDRASRLDGVAAVYSSSRPSATEDWHPGVERGVWNVDYPLGAAGSARPERNELDAETSFSFVSWLRPQGYPDI